MSSGCIVLAGAGGMLGSAFQQYAWGSELVRLGRDQLDVSQPRILRERLERLAPELVINCAADTDVERAESDSTSAYAVNALLPELLAQSCKKTGARFVHFSSTGCYGNWKQTPYGDYDPLQPTTVHHTAKAAGEQAVRGACPDALILRLGWLYGGAAGQRKNFVSARIAEARTAKEILSDPYQTGSPSHVADVVAQCVRLLEEGVTGTLNCVAGGAVSRFEYVLRIVELAGLSTRLRPRRFQRKAPVSPNEAASNDKLLMLGLNVMPQWEEALARYVGDLLASGA